MLGVTERDFSVGCGAVLLYEIRRGRKEVLAEGIKGSHRNVVFNIGKTAPVLVLPLFLKPIASSSSALLVSSTPPLANPVGWGSPVPRA